MPPRGFWRWSCTALGVALCVIAFAASTGYVAVAQRGEGAGEKRPRVRSLHGWDDLPDWITSLAFLKDNQHFVAGTYEQLLLFDARKEAAPKSEALPPGYVKALALSTDGKTLAGGHYQA